MERSYLNDTFYPGGITFKPFSQSFAELIAEFSWW